MAAPFRYNGSMSEPLRRLNLRPRLASAAAQLALLPDTACVADIGCDHGRLCCALLQQHAGWRCIASDLSAPSLRKAASLAAFVGVAERAEFRLGDGLLSLCPGEADAVALCGMGGTLIARLLEAAEDRACPRWCLLMGQVHLTRREYAEAVRCLQAAEATYPKQAIPSASIALFRK